MFLIILLN